MNRELGVFSFADLLPASIKDDLTVSAAAASLDVLLKKTTLAIPNLLIWARLDQEPERLFPPLSRLVKAAGGPKALDEKLLELLAWQFHVDFREVAGTRLSVLEKMVRNSIPWHRIKGTPASIEQAFALYGIRAIIEEDGKGENWATYQLGLTQVPDLTTVQLAYDVAREMAPVRCRLFRIYTDTFDYRPIILTEGPALSEGYLSFYSGVPVDEVDDGLVVSFGSLHAFGNSPADPRAWFGLENLAGMQASYLDRFIVGQSILSESYVRNHGFILLEEIAFQWVERLTESYPWQGEWDERPWARPAEWGRRGEPWSFYHREISRSQLCPGEACKTLSDTNSRLGTTWAETIDNPARLSEFALSEHDSGLHFRVLHELFEARAAFTSAVPEPLPSAISPATAIAFGSTPVFPSRTWHGAWDSLPWYPHRAAFKITHEQLEEGQA